MIINKDPNNYIPHRVRLILLLYIESKIQKKHLGTHKMRKADRINVLAPEQYGSHTVKAAEIQALNTKMFYDLIMLKRLPYISVFVYLVSKYNIILKNIASLSKPILCTIMTLQNMIH